MTAGTHTLRIAFTGGSQNLNWVKVNDASGANQLTNGAFATDLTGWLSYFMAPVGTAVWDAGTVRITPASNGALTLSAFRLDNFVLTKL